MNWLGTGSGSAALLDAPVAFTAPVGNGRSWWPTLTRRRHELTAASVAGPTLQELAATAMSAFRSQVIGTRCGAGPDADARVRVVIGSNPPSTDPSELEIWALLGDVDEDHVPARWDPTEVLADAHLTAWALQLRSAAISHLVTARWPNAERVTVRIDAADRVERRGGREYLLAVPIG